MQSNTTQQSLLMQLQDQIDSILNIAVQEWQMLPAEKINARPAQGKWSANECLQHLNLYSDYYLPAIQNALKNAPKNNHHKEKLFKSGWLGGYFTKLMQPNADGSLNKKMQSPKDKIPVEQKESHQVIADFISNQEVLFELLKTAEKVDIQSIRVPISIAPFIKLKLGDVFAFVVAHTERHVLQAKKALAVNIQ